jgi:hypothetical protein
MTRIAAVVRVDMSRLPIRAQKTVRDDAETDHRSATGGSHSRTHTREDRGKKLRVHPEAPRQECQAAETEDAGPERCAAWGLMHGVSVRSSQGCVPQVSYEAAPIHTRCHDEQPSTVAWKADSGW